MRRLTLAAMLLLAATISCRRKQAATAGNAPDTAVAIAAAPAPAPDTVPAVRNFSFDQRQEFVQSIRQQLASIDQQIKELADQAKSSGGAVSDRALARIRESRRAVDRRLKQVDAATAATWEKTKTGVNQAIERLNETIEGAQPK